MDKELIKSEIKTNVYHITFESDVKLHKHHNYDEIFYCLKGAGYGVLENSVKKLEVGDESDLARRTRVYPDRLEKRLRTQWHWKDKHDRPR